MVIGEAPGREEELQGIPFVGPSGALLNSLLQKAGLSRESAFVTNVVRERPPGNDISAWISDRKTPPGPEWKHIFGRWCHPNVARGVDSLYAEIEEVSPKIIIALGNTPLWALSGNVGIMKWRGSRLSPPGVQCNVLPTIHPAACLRQRELTPILLMDLKRARAIYEGTQTPRVYKFLAPPSFDDAMGYLENLLRRATDSRDSLVLSGDLETRSGHIACFGIADSASTAICIPFLRDSADSLFYWTEEQETVLIRKIIQLFLSPNITWIGQNYLYDCQYFHRFWGAVPAKIWDTMIGHHSIYSNLRKGLDFLSSMYAQDHVYWKDEIKNWDPAIGEQQLWAYNCKDCCITYEIWDKIIEEQASEGVSEHFYFQQSLFMPVLRMMNRGIRLDTDQRTVLRRDLTKLGIDRQEKLDYIAGHPLNPKSPAQLLKFFYEDLKIPGIRNLDTEALTTNAGAMLTIATRHPILKPLCQLILELRSIGVFISTFINADLDVDGRMRCSFAVAGTKTFRFSSSENAFNSGMNLQNVPKNTSGRARLKSDDLILPNIRKLFIPDPGYTFFDLDLDRADMQVVAAEADDKLLKEILAKGIDIHCMSAAEIYGVKGIPIDELVETHPNYRDHRAKIGEGNRDKTKNGGHATDYGVHDRKLAITLGITVAEAARFRARWFGLFPGIKKWHERVETEVRLRGFLQNKFGARFYLQGDFDLPEFLAWTPSSTVAGVINRALVRIDNARESGESSIELLLQVHDSLAGQYLTTRAEHELRLLREKAQITIPYDDPLVIPVGIKTSEKSWGDCK
jgi:DNA polymerase I-like protein with 3'-5' exonuclease and polymerase domains/uracil-DNA glycosylase